MTTPLCAPSRATFFRGQYAHNTGVRANNGANGGWTAFNRINENTIATWLRDAEPSYRTAHVGKHINGYGAARGQVGPIGPGWTDWIVPEPVAFYDYTLNVNGTPEQHGDRHPRLPDRRHGQESARHHRDHAGADPALPLLRAEGAARPLHPGQSPRGGLRRRRVGHE